MDGWLVLLCVPIIGCLVAWLVIVQRRLVQRRIERLEQDVATLPRGDELRGLIEAALPAARLVPVEEALRRLGDQVARLPAPVEPKDLAPLHDRLEQLARQIHELRHHIDELRARASEPSVAAVSPGGRLLRQLAERGFEHVHVLGELGTEEGIEPVRVPVEARRAGMSFKGYVTLEEGRLIEVALKPLTEIFP